MSLDLSAFEFAMKELYTDDYVRKLQYKDNPLHALLPKYENAGGSEIITPLLYGNPQARSASFSDAKALSTAAANNPKGVKFRVQRKKDYAFATVDGETMHASAMDAGAFMAAATTEFDGAIHTLTRSLAIAEYRNGTGTIGVVDTATANGSTSVTIQLTDPEEITNFSVGKVVNFYLTAAGSDSAITFDGKQNLEIISVDRDLGTFTINADGSVSTAALVGKYVCSMGDRNLKVQGLDAWIPAVAPAPGDNFCGVDRSVDPTRLAGIRYDGRGMPIDSALVQGVRRAEREGANISHIFINHRRWAELEISLGSRVVYAEVAAQRVADVGFRGIRIQGTKGFINVIADVNCPDDVAWALQMDTWQLASLGRPVDFTTDDGLRTLRQSDADGVEARMHYYANLRCFAPGYNARIQLS